MTSISKRRFLLGTTALASFDPTIVAFIDDLRVREGIVGKDVSRYRGTARHFLVWLGLSGIALETVDCTAIQRFLQHDCECGTRVPAYSLPGPWSKRRSWPPLMTFVRYLERTGRIETPGELDENLQLLDSFLGRMRADGHADIKTTESYLRASPAEKLQILGINTPPSIRPGTFRGARDSLMSVLGGQ